MKVRKILVPIDFSDHSAAALEYATGLAKALGAGIHLVHSYKINVSGISPYGVVLPETLDQDIRTAAEQHLTEWAEKARTDGLEVEMSTTPVFPSEAIANTAESIGADLIVMGTRGLTGLKHVLLGSVAERTLRIAPCPVLTLRATDAE